MISNLILAIGIVGATAIQPNDPTTRINNSVTSYDYEYQYQTNEVNSIDDLIVGNIYHLNGESNEYSFTYQIGQNEYYTYIYNLTLNTAYLDAVYNDSMTFESTNYMPEYNSILYESQIEYIQIEDIKRTNDDVLISYNYFEFSRSYSWLISCDIVMTQELKQMLQDLITNEIDTFENLNWYSKSNYLGEITQKETTTNGLYNSIEEFIENYIFNNDKLKETEYTIMGATYNMAEWLAHTTTIVLMCVILFMLVYFIKWLFKQISNTFNLVGAY